MASLPLGAAYGWFVGAIQCVQFDFGLRRFGGYEYVPGIIGLSAVRAWGPLGASMVSALTAVVVLHRAGRRFTTAPRIDPRLPLFVGAGALLSSPIVASTGCLGAFVVLRAESGGTAPAFATAITDTLLAVDLVHGACASLIGAFLVAIGLRWAAPLLLRSRWWLLPKLFVAWLGLQGLAYANGYAGGALFGDPVHSVDEPSATQKLSAEETTLPLARSHSRAGDRTSLTQYRLRLERPACARAHRPPSTPSASKSTIDVTHHR